MFGENAVRRSAAPISSATEWKMFLKISSSTGSRVMDESKSTTPQPMGRLKVKLYRQNCVDIQNNTPQYLGCGDFAHTRSVGRPRESGFSSKISQGKIVHGGETSWQPRKRPLRKKRNTNCRRESFSHGSEVQKGLAREAPLARLFSCGVTPARSRFDRLLMIISARPSPPFAARFEVRVCMPRD